VAIFYGEPESKETALTSLEREAQWVARSVSKLHREEPKETIAILVPVRTHLDAYVEALGEVDVPLRLMEGMRLEGRPEVRHLLNLFTAMVRPYDDLAWAGALRAPWFRVSNQVLLDLASVKGSGLRDSFKKESFPTWPNFVLPLRSGQNVWREPYASTPVEAVGRTWMDRDSSPFAMRSGNRQCKGLFDLLDPCSGLPGEEAMAESPCPRQGLYAPDPRGSFSNVSMMTIHKAKGSNSIMCLR
jgi:hypothetical protein